MTKLGSRANGSQEGIWNQVVQNLTNVPPSPAQRELDESGCGISRRHLPTKQYTMFTAVSRRAICSASRQTSVVTRQFSALVEATEEFPG